MKRSLASTLLFTSLTLSLALSAHADTASDLQKQIDDKNAALQALQQEIAQYEAQLVTIGSAKQTLQAEINLLDTSRKKLSADISVTQNRIATANLTLQQLGDQIADKGQRITDSEATIGSSLRSVAKLDEVTVAEHFLSGETLSAAWQDADRLSVVQSALGTEIEDLSNAKTALEANQAAVTKQQQDLQSYKKQLAGQKTVLDQNRTVQATVLSETKNKESNYQTILDQKKAAADALQQDISNYEAQLKYTLDPSAIPPVGSGTLGWPVDPAFMQNCQNRKSIFGNLYCITQYFGNTAFAQSGAYNGKGHNGIDIGAPTGTRVVAAAPGVVLGTGNTDLVSGCYSFGKWVMVKHDNGLATIYAHLSSIGVTTGEAVTKGEYLGLSGATGYVTGPHLHFGVYVASQVKILNFSQIAAQSGATTHCAGASVPIAPTQAYLNPIQYL